MSNTKPPKGENLTSWKLNILNAACSDDRLTAGEFRMLFLIVRRCNETKHEITLSDDLIRDEVPDCKGERTPSRNRKRLRHFGYLQYRPGDGNRGTVYKISDSQVILIEDAIDELREARKANAKEKPSRKLRKRDEGVSVESSRKSQKADRGISAESASNPQKGIRTVPGGVSEEIPVHTELNILGHSLSVPDDSQVAGLRSSPPLCECCGDHPQAFIHRTDKARWCVDCSNGIDPLSLQPIASF